MGDHPILVNDSTLAMLGKLSRLYGVTYGEVVEMLAVEQMLRDALDDESAAALISSDAWAKIRERLKHVPGPVDEH